MSDRPTPRTDYFCRKLKPSLDNWNKWQRTASFAAGLELELAEAREENLEQARLLSMSGEREADLRGELEREKRRAEENGVLAHDLGIQLAEAREQRDRLAQVIEAATDLHRRALTGELVGFDSEAKTLTLKMQQMPAATLGERVALRLTNAKCAGTDASEKTL